MTQHYAVATFSPGENTLEFLYMFPLVYFILVVSFRAGVKYYSKFNRNKYLRETWLTLKKLSPYLLVWGVPPWFLNYICTFQISQDIFSLLLYRTFFFQNFDLITFSFVLLINLSKVLSDNPKTILKIAVIIQNCVSHFIETAQPKSIYQIYFYILYFIEYLSCFKSIY